jgi:putative peptide zinc metalloprotease protein
MLIYFQPPFYCNVSDAWLFPEKSKRLWVTFTGACFETFLWALATLVW